MPDIKQRAQSLSGAVPTDLRAEWRGIRVIADGIQYFFFMQREVCTHGRNVFAAGRKTLQWHVKVMQITQINLPA